MSSGSQGREQFPSVLVDTEEGLRSAVSALEPFDEVAFDAEGIDLSRHGALTVASFMGFGGEDRDSTPAFVVDVQVLGHDVVFGERSKLRALLENKRITKLTFDVRGDSDALLHQFGVRLYNALDTQVYHQGVRLHEGEEPPKVTYTSRGRKYLPYVQSMAKISERYLTRTELRLLGHNMPAPHKYDSQVWGKRPIRAQALHYAGADVHTICLLVKNMRRFELTPELLHRVKLHSARYVSAFRDLQRALRPWPHDKEIILLEHSILDDDVLPASMLREHGLSP